MDFFGVLTLLGGLALFLYGMQLMGDGLKKVSGGRLENILETLTSNKLRGVLLGLGVTAVIQSSSATTVMVVGFVNSGIMKLTQAVGIIMGANIGTTVTSWILSLTGIQGSNFFISMLKPSSFSPILAFIGIIFLMFSKSEKKKDVSIILIGFAILMFGMEQMSGSVEPLADDPNFTHILLMFSEPVLGLLAGAALTAIIQSSSASVGILQALSLTGAVSFGTAFPIIMGQNIGTCITALLSAIGTSKNAKRAAFVHFYFNLFGTIIFMILFYGINAFVHFAFLSYAANAFGIAIIHTTFNVFTTIIMFPASNLLVKMACMTVKDTEEIIEVENRSIVDEDLKLLDDRFLSSPSLAVEHCKKVTMHMADISRKACIASSELIKNYNKQDASLIAMMEQDVDKYEDILGAYLVKVSAKNLTERDSQTLSILLHCIGDFERMSDHAVNIMESVIEMKGKKKEFSEKAQAELNVYINAIQGILNLTLQVFLQEDTILAIQVEPFEEVIDRLNAEIKKRHIKRLRKGKCTIELGFIYTDIITSFERIADHCYNIAVSVLQSKDDSFEVHEYKENLKNTDKNTFDQLFDKYNTIYSLGKKEQ